MSPRLGPSLLVVLSLLSIVPARAETPAPDTGNPADLPERPPARPGMMRARQDASVAPAPRGPYVHDGVFARLSVGPGLFAAWSGRSPDTRTFSGGAVAIHGAVGGTAARGFVIGGELQTNRVFSLSSTDSVIDGDEPDLGDTRFSVTSLGLFFDFYPVPTDGLHLLASAGAGWLDVSRSGASPATPAGPLLALGAGYEWFVGPNISVGLMLRGNLGLFSVRETTTNGSVAVTTFIPVLLATATYN